MITAIQILVVEDELSLRMDMPVSMDGLKLADAVRDRWPPVKIIVVSGHRAVAITDLPDGSRFFFKPYSPVIWCHQCATSRAVRSRGGQHGDV